MVSEIDQTIYIYNKIDSSFILHGDYKEIMMLLKFLFIENYFSSESQWLLICKEISLLDKKIDVISVEFWYNWNKLEQ